MADDSPKLVSRLHDEGFQVELLPGEHEFLGAIERLASSSEREIAVLDGYGFGSAELGLLKEAGIPTLFLDDYGHASHYSAAWVLNQNLYADPEMYSQRDRETKLLLGPAYALLREEFLPWISWRPEIQARASKVLVTMGGSDAENATAKIIESLADIAKEETNGDLEVVVAIGSANPHAAAVQCAAEQSPAQIRIVQSAQDMPALMSWADVAIAAAGGTAQELCFFGVPSLLFVAADNQRKVAESLASAGAAVHLGTTQEFNARRFLEEFRSLLESRERRETMSKRGRDLVDGLGAERVCGALTGRELRLRAAYEDDCRLLFDWANDPVTRAASFHSAPISWDEHTKWYAQRLRDPQSVLYVGETDAQAPVGQVRFQRQGESATLSVSVAPEFRGAGWGAALISFSIRALIRAHPVSRIDAQIKPENEASIRLFRKSGFRQIGTEEVAGRLALRFAWECKMGAYAA